MISRTAVIVASPRFDAQLDAASYSAGAARRREMHVLEVADGWPSLQWIQEITLGSWRGTGGTGELG